MRSDPDHLAAVADRFGLEIACGKIAHETQDRAIRAMRKILKRDPDPEGHLGTYLCGKCGRWHLGNRGRARRT